MKTRIAQTITVLIIVAMVAIAFINNQEFDFDATNQINTESIAEESQAVSNKTSKKTFKKLTR